MVDRKKKTKICDKVSDQEDRISHLPDHLRSEILYHLSTKDAVRTSVLSTRWRNLWQLVPGLDLDADTFSNIDALRSFAESFFDSHRESWIHKLQLSRCYYPYGKCDLNSWIDHVTKRRIRHLDVDFVCPDFFRSGNIPLSLYTCKTLVHLRLCYAALSNAAEFVSLPCLKIMHLENIRAPSETTLQKLISGSPVLEDLMISSWQSNKANVLQVSSQTLKRIDIDRFRVVIDAPLLQCLRARVTLEKNFKIINMGFSTKLDIEVVLSYQEYSRNVIHDILTDISRVRDLVITYVIWKEIFLYSKSGPVLQFRNLTRLNAGFSKPDLEMLPTILESCPKLESFILELVHPFIRAKKKKEESKVMFSTVPRCLVSSLKLVELKRSIPGYEGEMELVRYLLKNSTILEKLKLDIYYTKKAKCDFLKELVAMPRCSSVCEVLVL